MSAEAKAPEMKEPTDEGISDTDDTDKQFVDIIDEDSARGATFTREDLEALPSDHEGQFIWLILLLGFLNLKLANDDLW